MTAALQGKRRRPLGLPGKHLVGREFFGWTPRPRRGGRPMRWADLRSEGDSGSRNDGGGER